MDRFHSAYCNLRYGGDKCTCDYESSTSGKDLEIMRLRDCMIEARDLARTGLPTFDMTQEEWNFHRLNRISAMLTHCLEKEG